MQFGESQIIRQEGELRLLKIGCRNNKISYCVIGNGPTKHHDEYEDALDDYNLRWAKAKYGEQ